MAHENLLATIDAVRAVRNFNPDRWKGDPYQNCQGLWGWHFAFWWADSYHFISIHNYPAAKPSPGSIAYAIEGIEYIPDEKWGVYGNKKGSTLGYYATALSTRALGDGSNHWFMIGRSCRRSIESAATEIRSLLLRKSCPNPEELDLLQYLSRRTDRN